MKNPQMRKMRSARRRAVVGQAPEHPDTSLRLVAHQMGVSQV